jgi:hypothetical protein
MARSQIRVYFEGGQSRGSVPGTPHSPVYYLNCCNREGRERKKKVRQNGGVTAAKQRRTGGESAAEEISCRSGALLVLAFRSFLMKADLGEAGLIPLILRRQHQSHNRSTQVISTQNGFRRQRP